MFQLTVCTLFPEKMLTVQQEQQSEGYFVRALEQHLPEVKEAALQFLRKRLQLLLQMYEGGLAVSSLAGQTGGEHNKGHGSHQAVFSPCEWRFGGKLSPRRRSTAEPQP